MSSPGASYLESEVLTASPWKLHLMLIEGAISRAERARSCWDTGEYEQATESLIRAQQIITEMLANLNRESEPELARRVAAVYLFVFRTLLEAGAERDGRKLGEAIRVLAVERETWREACRRQGGSPSTAAPPPHHLPSPHAPIPDSAPGSFSLEA